MWPFDRPPASETIRLGGERVERWVRRPDGLVLVDAMNVAAGTESRVEALVMALDALLAADRLKADIGVRVTADVVIESAWLPVLPLEAAGALWSRNQLEALMRHRLVELYSSRESSLDWSIQLDYDAGDSHGLGYAMPQSLKEELTRVGERAGRTWSSLQPALPWGWQMLGRHRRNRTADPEVPWVWLEQDRSLVAFLKGGQVVGLNPAASVPSSQEALKRLIHVEAERWGISLPDDRTVSVGAWEPEPKSGNADGRWQIEWLSVASNVEHASAESGRALPDGA